MSRETVTLSTADGPMEAFVAHPVGRPRGGVVVAQEAFGLTDYIVDVCDRFATAGWRAIAPALFHRAGSPVFPYDGDFTAIRPTMQTLNSLDILEDVDASMALLADEGTAVGRIAVVGFCMGGTVATIAAVHRPLGAAVSFYGGGLAEGRFGEAPLIEIAPRLQAPWLGLFGDRDQSIPVEQVEAIRSAAQDAPAPTKIVRYPDAGHGFHCDARPAAYNAAAAEDAWARTLTWLEAHIPT
ncbi:dienelactone hydrolase family protein [Protofrankia symbiont of Coriaria ruscifolia]|uniref:dienelactone hydrolase family protein n=1 Tax=Protofrankia symbiont of Coriaria ruscifolia TaxID=1306542 RepID=UPI0010419EBF|nr:dienelactone hydrolase family protein [Protofrankia symbiont of Coriaria ruscifolia]